MGLGVALTGFLTGFAKQATAEIETRNKELRDSIDRQIEEHKKKVELSIEEKKKLRKDMRERHGDLAGIFDTLGKEFSYGQMAYVISSDERAAQFKNLTKQFDLNSVDGRQEIINRVQLGKNSPKFDSLDDAIELTTQVEKVVEPVVVSTRTAFGLPSNIQPRRLKAAKEAAPQLFKQPKDSVRLRGSIMPKFDPKTAKINDKTIRDNIINRVEKNTGLTQLKSEKGIYIRTDSISGTASLMDGQGVVREPDVLEAYQKATKESVSNFLTKGIKGDTITNDIVFGINSALAVVGLDPIPINPQVTTMDKAEALEAIQSTKIKEVDPTIKKSEDFQGSVADRDKMSALNRDKPKKEQVTLLLQQIRQAPKNSEEQYRLMERLRGLGFNSPKEAIKFLEQ